MNNIAIAKETIKITKKRKYAVNGEKILLPDVDFSAVEVISPDCGAELLGEDISGNFGEMCRIIVTNEDSFQAAGRYENPFVMNFANAHNAGGGFMLGANAQEEALCRCSTLYASITADKAGEMYRYNNTHLSSVDSDYMLYSPSVCVFRDEKCNLIKEHFMAAVVTIAAPNRNGGAMFTGEKKLAETMMRRIRIMLRVAVKHGHRNLVLGAWGCGAFRNNPRNVAEYFRSILIDEGYGKCFDEVCFAVYGKEDGRNITEFRNAFK